MINFNISQLFEQAFGVPMGKPYDTNQLEFGKLDQPTDYTVKGNNADSGEFVTVRNAINQNLPTGKPVFMPIKLGDLVLPNEPSMTISSRKNIVETSLVGSTRRGTVKELISIEDWSITIRGIAINYNSQSVYPEDIVKGLNNLYGRNEAIEIQSGLTSLLGIYRVVIQEVLFPEMIGVQHAQAYQFTCVSDEEFLLELQ